MEYHERLTAPAWYWIVGVLFGSTSAMAMGLWLGPQGAVISGIAVTALVTLGVAWLGRSEIAVDSDGLHADGGVLEWPWVGEVEVLDADQTRNRLGVDADARAWVLQRAWLPESVVVHVEDAADPHPYWLLSSRRPEHLAVAIQRARAAS